MKNLLLSVIVIYALAACNNAQTSTNAEMKVNPEELTNVALEKAKAIYYSLPTPMETAMVLENTGSDFIGDFLLSPEMADFYETSDKQALCLGVYTADLSYTAMFGQTQTAINYLSVTKNLITKLGLINIISDSVIQAFQNNMNNQDKLLNLISEQYLNVNAFLDENNKHKTSAYLILGGYIESLYIALNLVLLEPNQNKKLAQIIYDQHITLNDLIDLLNLYKDDKEISNYISELKKLQKIYSQIQMPLNNDNYKKLIKQTEIIRNQIIKK